MTRIDDTFTCHTKVNFLIWLVVAAWDSLKQDLEISIIVTIIVVSSSLSIIKNLRHDKLRKAVRSVKSIIEKKYSLVKSET